MALLLLIYHAFNIYTDLKWRITKSIWHLIFFLGGVLLSANSLKGEGFKEIAIFYALSVVLWLLIGLILESALMYSPGDTKMMIVSALWLSALAGESYGDTLVAFGFGVAASLMFVGMIGITKGHGFKRFVAELKSHILLWLSYGLNPFRIMDELRRLMKQNQQDKAHASIKAGNIPGAVPIAAGTLFALLTI